MLNKELLMVGSEQGQRKVVLTIGFFSRESSWGYSKFGYGSLDVLPYWGAKDIRVYSFAYGGPMATTVFYLEDDSVKVTAYVEGYKKSIASGYISKDDLYNMRGSEGEVRYLTFDPPRRVLGSRNTRTDLRRGYYVEEVPWEAQDAEQGTSYDGRCRRGVDSTVHVHRGLLYRSIANGSRREYHLGRESEPGYPNGSNTSEEYTGSLREPTRCSLPVASIKRNWVPSRRRVRIFTTDHSVSKQCIPRNKLHSVTSKEALYA